MRVQKVHTILIPLTAALFLAGSVSGTELKNIEKITPQGSQNINITGALNLNGNPITDTSGDLTLEGGSVEIPNGNLQMNTGKIEWSNDDGNGFYIEPTSLNNPDLRFFDSGGGGTEVLKLNDEGNIQVPSGNLAVSGNTDGVDLDNPGTAITVNSNQYEVSDNSISVTELDTGSTDTRYLNRGGDAMNGNLNMGGNRLENVGTPNSEDDAFSAEYWARRNNKPVTMSHDGYISWDGSQLSWSDRLIVIPTGNAGTHFDVDASNSPVNIDDWNVMYIRPSNSDYTSGTSVNLAPQTADYQNYDPKPNDVILAWKNGDTSKLYLSSGETLATGERIDANSIDRNRNFNLDDSDLNEVDQVRGYSNNDVEFLDRPRSQDGLYIDDGTAYFDQEIRTDVIQDRSGGNTIRSDSNINMNGNNINNIGGLQNCGSDEFVNGNGDCTADSNTNTQNPVNADLVAGGGLTGGSNNVLPGGDSDVTISLNANDLDNQGNINDFSAASDLNQNGDITSFDNANDLNSNGDISSFDNANDLDSSGNLQSNTVADNEIKDNTVDNTEIQNSNQFTFGGITNNGNLDMNNNRVRKVSNLDVSTSSEQIASFSSTGIDFNQPLSLESSGPLSVANGVDLTGSGSNTLESYSTLYLTTSSGSPSDIVLDPSGQVGVDSDLEIVGNTSIKGNLDLNKNTLTGVSALEDEDGNSCGDNEFLDGNGNCDTHSVDDSVEGSELDGTFSSNGVLKRTGDNTYTAKGTLPDGDVTKSLTIDNTGNIDARSIQLDGSTLSSSGSGLKVDASKVNINNLKNSGDLADEASVSTSQIDEDAVTNTEIANSQTLKVSRIEDSDDNTYYVNPGDSTTSANLNGAVKVDTGEVSSDQRMCIGDRCA